MFVFVYGTLLSGQGNHRLLAGAEKLGPATLEDNLDMISLGAFPALVSGLNKTSITGEVYSINDAILSRLDRLEGYPNFYTRKVFDVSVQGVSLPCWVYLLNESDFRGKDIIKSGNWREYQENRFQR